MVQKKSYPTVRNTDRQTIQRLKTVSQTDKQSDTGQEVSRSKYKKRRVQQQSKDRKKTKMDDVEKTFLGKHACWLLALFTLLHLPFDPKKQG